MARIDRGHERLQARAIAKRALAHAGEGRVSEPAVAIVKRPLLDLRQPVHRFDAGRTEAAGAGDLDHHRHLGQHGPRGRCRRREDVDALEVEAERLAQLGGVAPEVAAGDESARAFLIVFDGPRHAASIEPILCAIPDRLEGPGQIGLLEKRADRRRLAAGQEDPGRLRIGREALGLARDRVGDGLGHDEPIACEAHGGIHDAFPRKPPRPAVGEREAGHRARHPRSQRACLGRGDASAALARSDEEVAAGRARSRLAEVDRRHVAPGVARDPESAAADVAGFRPRHGEGEGHGHGGVRRVAALLQDPDPGPGRVLFGGGDRAAGAERGLRCRRRRNQREDRRRKRENERESEGEEGRNASFHCAILPAR